MALSAGGRYRAPKLSVCWSSLALQKNNQYGRTNLFIYFLEKKLVTHLLANAAEGAGGGVFPLETLE